MVQGSENHLCVLLHHVRWATNSKRPADEYMGIDHGGAHIPMAQEFLDRTDVLPPFQQVGRVRWP
jgi:hypothetical protein